MNKHAWSGAFIFLLGATLAIAGQSSNTNAGSWSGVIINGSCSVDEAFGEGAKCTAATPGSLDRQRAPEDIRHK